MAASVVRQANVLASSGKLTFYGYPTEFNMFNIWSGEEGKWEIGLCAEAKPLVFQLGLPLLPEADLPSHEKANWMLANIAPDELPEMTSDLLHAAIDACAWGDIESLALEIVGWESTIELERDDEFLRQTQQSDTEKGRPWKKIEKELSLK